MTIQSGKEKIVGDGASTPPADAATVAEYLSRNLDFFNHFPELLERLAIPHSNGSAISLVERQVQLLREKNSELESRLNTLLEVAQQNNEIQQQLHRLAIEVLATSHIDAALDKLDKQLSGDMVVDHVRTRLFADDLHPLPGVDKKYVLNGKSAREALDGFTPSAEPFCGRLKPAQLKRLFGKNAESIRSCVVVPLRRGRLHGLIALGSNDEHRFNPGMDTLYLRRLGELVSASLLRFID